MKMNNKMTINLEGVGKAIATAVKREEGKTWYVFDDTVGRSNMIDMDNFLSILITKFPQSLQERLDEIRLLDASEVFSDCDMPEEWESLQEYGVTIGNPQISYFKSVIHRRAKYRLTGSFLDSGWGLRSMTSKSLFAYVTSNGYAECCNEFASAGVRPLFILKDIED